MLGQGGIMKKKLVYLVLLTILMAILLCACDKTNTPIGGKDTDNLDGWVAIKDVTPTDVYTKLIGGFTAISTDFSKSSLKTSPKLSVDSKLKLEVNKNIFWVTLKGNYNHTLPQDVMLALEISTEEDCYNSNILEMYVYKEKLNIGLGETKISFALPTSTWTSVFPFDITLDSSNDVQKVALLLATTLDLEDDSIVGKTRQNGTIEEFNYDFKISLSSSLKKIFDYLKLNSDKTYQDILNKFGTIVSNIFGVTISDITSGKFPKSTIKLNFSTSNRKISTFNLKLDVDIAEKTDTMLFPGQNLNLDIELIKLVTSKKDNVNIDFVINTEKQNKYIYYVDKAFNITANVTRTENDIEKNYKLNVIAKILQDDNQNNYLFVELINTKKEIVKAIYFYQNFGYYYDIVDTKLECLYKFPIDLSAMATKLLNNDFLDEQGKNKSDADVLSLLSYFMGALRITDDGVKLIVTESFFTNVWYNFDDMIAYVNELYEEDLSEIPALTDAYNYVVKCTSSLYVEYSKSLIMVYEDDDLRISYITNKLNNAEPLHTLTLKAIPAE